MLHPEFKITLRLKGTKVRLTVAERTNGGKFADFERPVTQSDIQVLKRGAKAMSMLSHGVTDLKDISREASSQKRRRKPSERVRADQLGLADEVPLSVHALIAATSRRPASRRRPQPILGRAVFRLPLHAGGRCDAVGGGDRQRLRRALQARKVLPNDGDKGTSDF